MFITWTPSTKVNRGQNHNLSQDTNTNHRKSQPPFIKNIKSWIIHRIHQLDSIFGHNESPNHNNPTLPVAISVNHWELDFPTARRLAHTELAKTDADDLVSWHLHAVLSAHLLASVRIDKGACDRSGDAEAAQELHHDLYLVVHTFSQTMDAVSSVHL